MEGYSRGDPNLTMTSYVTPDKGFAGRRNWYLSKECGLVEHINDRQYFSEQRSDFKYKI
jgi:hypothetical protein